MEKNGGRTKKGIIGGESGSLGEEGISGDLE